MADRRRMRPLLGTFVEIGIPESIAAPTANVAFNHAFAIIDRMQQLLSFQNPDSELSRLNRTSAAMTLHPLSVLALRLSRGMTRASGGLFNCTLGGHLIEAGVLPNYANKSPLLCGNADDIAIHGRQVQLLRPVQITVDGIAKGLAIDLAARTMREAGADAGWINAGGDLLAFGSATSPIRRRELDGCLTPLAVLRNGAIASSAVNPIIDPRFPGRIVGAGNAAPTCGVWSVRARSAWRADALTKVAALAPAADRASRIFALGGELLTDDGDGMTFNKGPMTRSCPSALYRETAT